MADWTVAAGMTLREKTLGGTIKILRRVADDPAMWAIEGTIAGSKWEAFIRESVLQECFDPVKGEACDIGPPSSPSSP